MASGSTSVAFVTELNSTGTALNYSTYLGGSGDPNGDGDAGAGIAVDSSHNTYVTGQTYSTDFPTTPGAFQTSNNDRVRVRHRIRDRAEFDWDGAELFYLPGR